MQKNIEARDFINMAFDGMEYNLKLNQEINSEGEQQSDEEVPREYSINKASPRKMDFDNEEAAARNVLS